MHWLNICIISYFIKWPIRNSFKCMSCLWAILIPGLSPYYPVSSDLLVPSSREINYSTQLNQWEIKSQHLSVKSMITTISCFLLWNFLLQSAKKNPNATKYVLNMHTMTKIKHHFISACQNKQLLISFINVFRQLIIVLFMGRIPQLDGYCYQNKR